jgi:hypothetical protein
MNAAVENKTLSPNELTLHSIEMSEGIKDYYPATVRVEFRGVDDNFEKTALTKALEALTVLLVTADDLTIQSRLETLCHALQLEDWRANRDADVLQTGNEYMQWFFKTMPLLDEQEVNRRMPSNATVTSADLMQITYNDRTFYFADQFASDGSIHSECIECWRILKSNSRDSQWERALWWVSNTGWLEGRCAPRDIFKEDTQGVLHAAEQDAIQDEH